MSIRTTIVSLAGFVLLAAGSGCEISHCEQGAVCTDEDEDDRGDQHGIDPRVLCIAYCDRLDVCGAPQADDFDECVESCEERFDRSPERTLALCECAESSRCADVIEGRCTSKGTGTAGKGSGGRSNEGGSTNVSGGPSAGGSTAGGASAAGGPGSVAGSSTGGAPGGAGSSGTGPGSGGTGEPPACVAGGPGVGAAGESGDGAGGDASCSCPIP